VNKLVLFCGRRRNLDLTIKITITKTARIQGYSSPYATGSNKDLKGILCARAHEKL